VYSMNENQQITWGQLFREKFSIFSSEWYYLMQSITAQVIIAFIIGATLHWVSLVGWTNCLYAGAIIWVLILCFTPVINTFFVNVPANHGAVFSNQLLSYEKPIEGSVKLQETHTLREVGPGLQGKWPWEVIVNNDNNKARAFINLQRKVPVGTTITVYTKDNVPYVIEYAVFLTALRGHLCNFIRFFDENIARYFQAQFSQYLINQISKLDEKGLMEAMVPEEATNDESKEKNKHGKIGGGFKTLFGGKDSIDATEKEYGTFTGDPVIIRIEIDPEFKKVLSGKKRASAYKEALAEVKSGNEKVDPDLANITAAGLMDIETGAKYIRISGLENLTHFVGAVPGFDGSDDTQKNKKDKK
jgi:hypothetical protein